MIRYSLQCDRGHAFESWFQDSASFDKQVKRKLVTCPTCDSAKVEKSIMAPQIPRKGRTTEQRAVEEKVQKTRARRKAETTAATPAAAAPTAAPAANPLMALAQEAEFRAKLKAVRDHIKANADDVGTSFPEEARKMHYGEIEHRPIYGEASPTEAKELVEEGVEVMPLPVLPDDRN